ncbi:MAG: hypothetical protein ACRDB0_06565 [Paraclostridium sp.]
MSRLGKAIKNNIVAPHDKYSITQEKVAEVLDADERLECCDILYINVDGIPTTATKVPVKTGNGLFAWFPKAGDKVEIREQGKRVIIVGESKEHKAVAEDTSAELDYYSNLLSGTTGGYLT